MSEIVIDVAIVGRGVSGLYTGWRLLSLDPPEMVGIKAAFGGMLETAAALLQQKWGVPHG